MEGEAVRKAVHSLFYATVEEERRSAMQWLESFQNSFEAWAVSCSFLADPNTAPEVLFFSAQTLKHKVVSDLAQLDETAARTLAGSLRTMAFQAGPMTQPIRTQLLLALAGILVQLPGEHISPELQHANGPGRDVLLQLLAFIPEQLANPAIHLAESLYRERRDCLLVRSAPAVLPILIGNLEGSSSSTTATRSLAIDSLQAWIRYADLDSPQACHVLAVTSRLLAAISGDDPEAPSVVEGACEIVCELAYKQREDGPWALAWAGTVPEVCSLLRALLGKYVSGDGAFDQDDLDEGMGKTVKALVGMLAETGELFLGDMLRVEPMQSALNSLIPTLLLVVGAPGVEARILEGTFNFWSSLEAALETCSGEELRAVFVPVYSQLFGSLLPRLQFPPAEADSESAEEREAFRDFRHVIGDCLKDCVRVIGSSAALELIWGALDAALAASNAWQPVEAVLFSLRTVSSAIDRRESEVLPRLFPRVLRLTSHPKHVYSVLLIIGCLADWLRHPSRADLLQSAVHFVAAGVQFRGDPAITAAAATALRYLCESCGPCLLPLFDSIADLYCASLSTNESSVGASGSAHGSLGRSDQLSLTESVCHVLAAANITVGSSRPSPDSPYASSVGNMMAYAHAGRDEESAHGRLWEARLLRCLQPHLSLLTGSLPSGLPPPESAVCLALEQLGLFVDLVVPEATSSLSPHHPMLRAYLERIEPALEPLAAHYGPAVDPGLGELLKAAIIRYSRCLGRPWLQPMISLCFRLAGVRSATGAPSGSSSFPSMLLVIRYLIIMGDCPEDLQSTVRSGLVAYGRSGPAQDLARFEFFQAVIACLDYWQEAAADAGPDTATAAEGEGLLIRVCLPLLKHQMEDATAPTADLSAAVQLTLRIGTRLLGGRPTPSERQGGPLYEYSGLLQTLLAASLFHLPPAVQSDTAVLFHRLARYGDSLQPGSGHDRRLDIARSVVHPVLAALDDSLLPGQERSAWERQWTEAVAEARPKALKSVLINWASACRRRRPLGPQ